MTIHQFDDSLTAREAQQMSGAVKFGDTLVIESECIVGVSCNWPFAVTVEQGEFFAFTWDEPISGPNTLLVLVNSIRAAVAEAQRLGFPVCPSFFGYVQEAE